MSSGFTTRELLTPTWVSKDTAGHEFHGNQWTTGNGVNPSATSKVLAHGARLAANQSKRADGIADRKVVAASHENLGAQHQAVADQLNSLASNPAVANTYVRVAALRDAARAHTDAANAHYAASSQNQQIGVDAAERSPGASANAANKSQDAADATANLSNVE